MARKPREGRPTEIVEWLSPEEAADALDLPREMVRRWARDGDARLPAYRVWDDPHAKYGGFRYKRSDVEAFRELAQASADRPQS